MTHQCVQAQLVLFGDVDLPRDRATLLSGLSARFGGRLSGDQVILPLPDHVPPEIPRLQAASLDGALRVVVCRNRSEVVERLSPPHDVDALEKVQADGQALLDVLYKRAESMPVRCGLVTLWVVDGDQDPPSTVHRTYLRASPLFEGSSEIELHHLTRCELAGIKSNCWLRIQTAQQRSSAGGGPRLAYLVDINSHEGTRNCFDVPTLAAFIGGAWSLTLARLAQHRAALEEAPDGARCN